jgi:N-acetylglucosaminyldiphosphoundecaprenol N-acetyl-beta-D-mannosaminyltransferase
MAGEINLLGVRINLVNRAEAIQNLVEFVRTGNQFHYVCVANVDSVMSCRRNERMMSALNSSFLTVPDGMPLVWAGRYLGYPIRERVAGPDLMLDLIRISEQEGFTHYFYGSSEEVLTVLEKKLRERFPGIKIVGALAPPFRAITSEEDREIVETINAAGPDILWVGLGAPKQELWMADHHGRLKVPVMIGVGAAFDFHAGSKKRAPLWMQKSGLEWAWRLSQEPGRLWRRYLIDDLPFFWFILKQKYLG